MWQEVEMPREGGKVRVSGTDEIPDGEARAVLVGEPGEGGFVALLCRRDGTLFALDARCPHEGGMIVEGPLMDARAALCPLHHYHFDVRTGHETQGLCAPARTFEVVEEGGVAEILLGSGERR